MPSSNQQMDGSGDSGNAQASAMTKSASWACHMCSYENPLSKRQREKCEICFTPRLLTPPATATGSTSNGGNNPNEWSCLKCTFLNQAESINCGVCNEKKSSSSTSDLTWHCPQCTYSNKVDVMRCGICNYKKNSTTGGTNPKETAAAKIVGQRPSTASAAPNEPPMLLPVRQESEYMEALRAIDEAEANEQYQRILTFCRQNKILFVDDSFAPTPLSLQRHQHDTDGHNNRPRDLSKVDWRRPARIANFFERLISPWTVCDSPKPSDIVQGVLGNCWFLSALAVVAERPDILEHILVTKQICPEGVYQIRLCIDGQWRVVVVDDLFPCTPHGLMLYSKAKRNQLWVPLIEKALAKVSGSYDTLTAGRTIEGLAILTGSPCEPLLLPGHGDDGRDDSRDRDLDVIWAKLLSMKDAKFLMGASCGGDREGRQEEYQLLGLEPLHAYSLLDVREVNGARLVKCRNPWGHFSWNGDWSEHSSRWTPELLAELMPERFRDGIFWMPFEDFCRYFDTVDICRYRSNWREMRLAGLLPPHCRRNFVYVAELAVHEATEVDVAIYQPNVRSEQRTKHGTLDLGVMVFAVDEYGRPARLVSRSEHTVRSFVTLSAILQPGQYIMVWMSLNHWGMRLDDTEIPKCVVAVHSARALTAQVRSVNPTILADCVIQMAMQEGRTSGRDTPGAVVYYLTKRWTGVVIVAANWHKDAVVNIQCDCTGSQNAVSTRGTLITSDSLPPMHRQVVMSLIQVEGTAPSSFAYRVVYQASSMSRNRLYPDVFDAVANRVVSFLGGQPSASAQAEPQPIPNSHMPELDADNYGLHAPRPIV